jgi:hypothetical protein
MIVQWFEVRGTDDCSMIWGERYRWLFNDLRWELPMIVQWFEVRGTDDCNHWTIIGNSHLKSLNNQRYLSPQIIEQSSVPLTSNHWTIIGNSHLKSLNDDCSMIWGERYRWLFNDLKWEVPMIVQWFEVRGTDDCSMIWGESCRWLFNDLRIEQSSATLPSNHWTIIGNSHLKSLNNHWYLSPQIIEQSSATLPSNHWTIIGNSHLKSLKELPMIVQWFEVRGTDDCSMIWGESCRWLFNDLRWEVPMIVQWFEVRVADDCSMIWGYLSLQIIEQSSVTLT